MQLRAEQLEGDLARRLHPLYVIHGDEPLLALEAADAVRARSRANGFTEREVLLAERSFDWSQLTMSAAGMSLFGDKKLIELRIPSGKPGTDGAAAIQAHCRGLPPDTTTLVTLPRLDRQGQNSAWFGALSDAGAVVNVYPIERTKLPQWIAARLARQKQRAGTEAIEFLVECVEGNLLAAHQEIQKLGLLYPEGELTLDQVRDAVLDVARFNVYQLTEAVLGGDALRLARVLDGLAGEGEPPLRVLWVMSEDIRAVFKLQRGRAAGRRDQEIFRGERIWGDARQRLVSQAATRVRGEVLSNGLEHAAHVDRVAKGVAQGDTWDELLQLGLRFAR
ncbi:MAG: DNA polymerase III subunit delta [Betaproteobacteria bacterium]|nr:DNA polymerase III subunit delta [Betaproteobacteria bacterium]